MTTYIKYMWCERTNWWYLWPVDTFRLRQLKKFEASVEPHKLFTSNFLIFGINWSTILLILHWNCFCIWKLHIYIYIYINNLDIVILVLCRNVRSRMRGWFVHIRFELVSQTDQTDTALIRILEKHSLNQRTGWSWLQYV